MRWVRSWSLAVLIGFVLIGTNLPAIGSPKAGTTCKKAQQTRVVGSVSFKCVKSGRKLVWKEIKASPIVVPAKEITPSPATSPSPIPSPTATMLTLPLHKNPNFTQILWSQFQAGKEFPIERERFDLPKTLPTSWDNLYEYREGIPFAAWKSIRDNMSAAQAKKVEIVKHQGPNTILTFADVEGVIELVYKAFPSVAEVKTTNVFLYNFRDRDWANEIYQKTYRDETDRFKSFHNNSALENCQISREVCWASAFIDSKLGGVMLIGVIDSGSSIQRSQTYSDYARANLGLTIAHEFFHVLQRRTIGESWFQRNYTPPIWFNEGTAVFSENAVINHLSFENFMRFRAVDSKLAYPGCRQVSAGCFDVDAATLERFFSLSNYDDNWRDFPYGMKYEVSSRIAEILVALKGPASLIQIYEEMEKKQTFDAAFEKVYEISYAKATPIISRILVDQYENNR